MERVEYLLPKTNTEEIEYMLPDGNLVNLNRETLINIYEIVKLGYAVEEVKETFVMVIIEQIEIDIDNIVKFKGVIENYTDIEAMILTQNIDISIALESVIFSKDVVETAAHDLLEETEDVLCNAEVALVLIENLLESEVENT